MRDFTTLLPVAILTACLSGVQSHALAQRADPENKPLWSTVCAKDNQGNAHSCRLVHRIFSGDSDKSQRLLTVQVHSSKQEAPYIRLQLPTDLDLQSGVSFAVLEEASNFTKLAYRSSIGTCNDSGCFARLPLDPELLTAMKTSKTVLVGYANSQQEKIKVLVSLNEFAEAYDSLDGAPQ